MMVASLRLFIAFNVPSELVDPSLMEGLAMPGLRRVQSGKIHLTLLFLGDTPEQDVPCILDVMRSSLEGISSFEFDVKGVGVFPNRKSPRVVWCGIDDGGCGEEMNERLVKNLGMERGRQAFAPHITVARVKQGGITDGLPAVLDEWKEIRMGHGVCDEVHLISSTLGRSGPTYKTLGKVSLL